MNITTLEECKQHTRVQLTDEDAILATYAEGAEETVLAYLERDLADIVNEYGDIPNRLKMAVWMLFAHFYAQRMPATIQNLYTVPYTFETLVKPLMSL